jgi:hypothetical protein
MLNRSSKAVTLIALLLMCGSIPVVASTAAADRDMAASFNVGLAKAFDDDFDDLETVFSGTYEYYTSPNFSWRAMLGITKFGAGSSVSLPFGKGGPSGRPSVDAKFLLGNAVYYWDRERIQPFVTGGAGFYQKDGSNSLPSSFDETVVGVNGGGGVDWFFGESRWAIKFEGTLHALTGENPDTFFLGTAGFKFWF